MKLEHKVAVIYGGGGKIGGAVAKTFALEGAQVFLAGRTEESLERVAAEIRASGGQVATAVVDALDEDRVDAFVDDVVKRAGHIDISFNLIFYDPVQKPLDELSLEEFMQPIEIASRSHFLTIRAAARHMVPRRSGVILIFGGGGPQTPPGLGGFKVALDAVESQRRQWAVELGPYGVRVVTMKTGGIPETIPPDFPDREAFIEELKDVTLLKRSATLEDVCQVAAFLASDQARTITATEVNMSAGSIVE